MGDSNPEQFLCPQSSTLKYDKGEDAPKKKRGPRSPNMRHSKMITLRYGANVACNCPHTRECKLRNYKTAPQEREQRK